MTQSSHLRAVPSIDRALVISDDPKLEAALTAQPGLRALEIVQVSTLSQALAELPPSWRARAAFDTVILDARSNATRQLGILSPLKARDWLTPVLVLVPPGRPDLEDEAWFQGAEATMTLGEASQVARVLAHTIRTEGLSHVEHR